MAIYSSVNRLDHLSFKGNLKNTRYGWLRLTPAYSVHLVSELLEKLTDTNSVVLDPFCGTGTTALFCAQRGIACDTTDINPFLLWLSQAKTYSYSTQEMDAFRSASSQVIESIRNVEAPAVWQPPLHQIEKWWSEQRLRALSRVMYCMKQVEDAIPEASLNLLKIAFCQAMIELSNVSFGHQSMSFKANEQTLPFLEWEEDIVITTWEQAVSQLVIAARSEVIRQPRFLLCDARNLLTDLERERYSCVVTSPPYPNRMSYIRELRPYMYWLSYLNASQEAGELDWQAIGGTWGSATSKLKSWQPDKGVEVPFVGFHAILEGIACHSPLLAQYVYKYFHDMTLHCRSLFDVVRPGGTITYIVGNSKFYDVLLPVECIFASLFEAVGFVDVDIQVIRKRSSKKELLEFSVFARKP